MLRHFLVCCALASAQALVSQPSRLGLSRRDVSKAMTIGAFVTAIPMPSFGAGSTDLKTDRVVAMNKYLPRIKEGRTYWVEELPKAIAAGDWKSIENSLTVMIDPSDKKGKKKKVGRIVGMVNPLELWASSFSRGAQRSPETIEMLAAVEELRAAVALLNTATASKVKDDGILGFFGVTKEPTAAEREKNAKQALAQGTKALNDYIRTVNALLQVMGIPTIAAV
jgi:hypothetical protein